MEKNIDERQHSKRILYLLYRMRTLFFYCFILLLAAGCKKDNNGNNGNTSGIGTFPNKIGDTWTYLVNDTTYQGFNSQNRTVAAYNMNVTVIDSILLPENINGIQIPPGTEAAVLVSTHLGISDTNYMYQNDDTVRFININQSPYSQANRQYLVPLSLHNSWSYSILSLPIWLVTVDTQANIIVQQNHFDSAYHVSGPAGMPDAGFEVDEWIVNNVGVVKRYIVESGIGGINHSTKWELVSYQLH